VLPAMGAVVVVVVEETEVELAASRPAVPHTDATWLLYDNHPNDQRRVINSSIGRPMMDVRQIAAQCVLRSFDEATGNRQDMVRMKSDSGDVEVN